MIALRDVGRETLDLDLAGHEVDEPAFGLDPDGLAEELERDRDPDGFVHGDLDEVGVEQLVRDRVDLEVFDHGVPASAQSKAILKIVFSPRLGLQDGEDVLLVQRQRRACGPFAVKDGRDPSGLPHAARGVFPEDVSFFALMTRLMHVPPYTNSELTELPFVDPADGFSEELGDGQGDDLGAAPALSFRGMVLVTMSFSMGECSIFSMAGPDRTGWVQAAEDRARPPAAMSASAAQDEGPGRVDHVVEEDAVAALDVADDVEDLGHVGRGPALVDDRQVGVQPLGEDIWPGPRRRRRARRRSGFRGRGPGDAWPGRGRCVRLSTGNEKNPWIWGE